LLFFAVVCLLTLAIFSIVGENTEEGGKEEAAKTEANEDQGSVNVTVTSDLLLVDMHSTVLPIRSLQQMLMCM